MGWLEKSLEKGGVARDQAARFITEVTKHPDKVDLIFSIASSQNGLKVVRDAIGAYESVEHFNHVILPFLVWLGSDEFALSASLRYLAPIENAIWSSIHALLPVFIKCLSELREPIALVWYLRSFLASQADFAYAARSSPHVREIATRFLFHEGPIKKMADDVLKLIHGGISAITDSRMTLPDAQAVVPGGRHDNDKEDFRTIQIVPTTAEISCTTQPYLPMSTEKQFPILERHFRLLREDMLQPVRDALTQKGKKDKQTLVFHNARWEDVRLPDARTSGSACIRLSFEVPSWHPTRKYPEWRKRKDYWEDRGHKVFARDTLVAIYCNDKLIRFGIVEWRDEETMAKGLIPSSSYIPKYYNSTPRPVVGISFLNKKDLEDTVQEFGAYLSLEVVQVPVSLFSYMPVLQQLQTIASVPFEDEFTTDSLQTVPPSYIREPFLSFVNNIIPSNSDNSGLQVEVRKQFYTLDISQGKALAQALQHRVAIIQGPPGTGKTFIGSLILQLIYEHTRARVLCVCYTNHALDQFLECLISAGITEIVRIGGNSKNAALDAYQLRNKSTRVPFTLAQNRQFAILKKSQDDLDHAIKRLLLQKPQVTQWETVRRYLEDNYPEILEEFTLPQEKGGMKKVGRKGKVLDSKELYKMWREGKPNPLHKQRESTKINSVWKYHKEKRTAIVGEWHQEIMEEFSHTMAKYITRLNSTQKDLQALRSDSDRAALLRARIIGCTTTGAAKYNALIRDARCEVVIVEEAAEILEAHVLACLTPHVKHLIQIGDHKQLRPKVCYQLQVESGKGYDLNCSLFERLALRNYPSTTLSVQHRMAPPISSHVRMLTYPELRDDPSVSSHPPLRGTPNAHVIFLKHTIFEESDKKLTQMQDGDASRSKVVSLCLYFLQQGYKEDQIVVLTPYLAQLRELRTALTTVASAFISSMDKTDLLAAGGDPDIPKDTKKGIRVATIDNYQGEESDVIIGSLVRSNKEGDVGFIGDKNRVNVLLSRARHGMVLVGNLDCLTRAKSKASRELWQKIEKQMQERSSLHTSFPAKCANHGTLSQLRTAEDFRKLVPDGGCNAVCGVPLSCVHKCPKMCHPSNAAHKGIRCKESARITCAFGHPLVQFCSEALPTCRTCEKIAAMKAREEERRREEEARLASEQVDIELELQQEKQNVKRREDELNQVLARITREEEVKKLKIEAERLEKEIEIKKQQERAVQEQQLAELERTTKQQLYELSQETADKTKQANSSSLHQQENQQTLPSVQQKVDTLLTIAGSVRSMNISEFQKILKTISTAEQTTLAQYLVDRIGIAALDWFAIARNDGATEKKDDKPRAGMDLLAKEEWMKARSFFEAKREKNEREAQQCVEDDLAYLLAASKLKLGDDPTTYLNELYRVDALFPTVSSHDYSNFNASDLRSINSNSNSDSNTSSTSTNSTKPNAHNNSNSHNSSSSNSNSNSYTSKSSSKPHSAKPHSSKLHSHSSTGSESAATNNLDGTSDALPSDPAELELEDDKKKRRPNRREKPKVQSPFGLRSLTFAVVHDLLAKGKPSVAPPVAHEVEAAAHALCFLASPTQWKKGLAKLDNLAKDILKRHNHHLNARLGYPNNTVSEERPVKASANKLWEIRKASGSKSDSLDKVMKMAGMESIKQKLLDQYDRICLDKQRGIDLKQVRYNVRLEGNPGTGKTTIARLYAGLLKELGILKADTMQETTGAKLVDGGVAELKKLLAEIEKGGGGLLFVDEAYTLSPQEPMSQGKQVLDYLLPEMENKVGSLVVAFAGYSKQMEQLFQYNDGLPSRFPVILSFEDFSDGQLFDILCDLVKKNRFSFAGDNPKYARISTKRLGKLRGTKGFGNARAVANLFAQIGERQAARIIDLKNGDVRVDGAAAFILERDDVLGPKVQDLSTDSIAWGELEAMTGLSSVKNSIRSLFRLVQTNLELEEEEKPQQQISLNRLFLGNPGTGKTTVAMMYGRILADLGLLSKGEVKIHNASEFVGSVLGASEENTRKLLKSAEGCVLVIDEAYGLFGGKSGDIYKTAVLNTIVEEVQNRPGEDKCVIMLGYENQMREMLRDSNPGLARRFQIEDAFKFEDYSNEELLEILDMKMRKQGVQAKEKARLAAIEVLEQQRNQPNFGNGGAVDNLLGRAILNMNKRTEGQPRTQELIAIDFGAPEHDKMGDGLNFDGLVGCDSVLKVLQEYKATISMARERGQDPVVSGKLELNFLFVGAPGTGKTTVANRMGQMFKSLHVLPSADVVVRSASDFSTGYVGQAGQKAREIMTACLGKVLFIDEAYRLQSDAFLMQATDELVQMLTEPKFIGKIVVILAGYERDMDELMRVNQGLRSRFSRKIVFPNFTVADSCKLMLMKLNAEELVVEEEAARALPSLMQKLVEMESFSNGRDVDTWAKRVFRFVASRRFATDARDSSETVGLHDLEESLKAMLSERQAPTTTTERVHKPPQMPLQHQTQDSQPPPPPAPVIITHATQIEKKEPPPVHQANPTDSSEPPSPEDFDKLNKTLAANGMSLDEGISNLQSNPNFLSAVSTAFGGDALAKRLLKRIEEELARRKREQEEAERKRIEEIARLVAMKKQEEAEKLRREQEKEQQIQQQLASMGQCVAGFRWLKTNGGYRCAGGSHYVTNAQLGL